VVKSARVMKRAVAYLLPFLEAGKAEAPAKARVLLATVKGDVHDIGKKIVSVVLQCNGYEVIDLGVMVPAAKILEQAREQRCSIIGLSGLITPSLDEMAHVAAQMQRQGLALPLLVGGATTSKLHTALKIAPRYEHPVVHVPDASRAVSVVSSLTSPELRPTFVEQVREEQEQVRKRRAGGPARRLCSIAEARDNRLRTDWSAFTPPVPRQRDLLSFESYPLARLVPRIDWTPFFRVWQLPGRYPDLLDRADVGAEAARVQDDARAMLARIEEEQLLTARGVLGFFPANTVGHDDVELYTDGSRSEVLAVLHFLRQQVARAGNARPNLCLADFVAPRETGLEDHVGLFAVTAGIGIEPAIQRLQRDHDDYGAIMLKALSDRLAEAFAEHLHERVRKELWGYAEDEDLDDAAIINEEYRGIRPAPGYPACPDHTEKRTLFSLIEVERRTGIQLTESGAMSPASSISGLYLSHPESRYFGVGKIGKDQVEDYARRKGWDLDRAERWLAPILGY
jgi:5-methyltetrahydrofolate--homocysteine methyltransferase